MSVNSEIKHEVTLFAEPIFHLGGFTVTNSLINSVGVVLILSLFFIAAGRKIRQIPSGLQNFFEIVLEGALKFSDSITVNRHKSEKLLPIVLSLFLFILVNNWLGLLPGIGTIGFIEQHAGEKIFVPIFRGGTADLNTTLALAMVAVLSVHVIGSLTVGAWNYFNQYLNVKAFLEIPRKFKNDKSVALVNPIKAFVGLIEIIGEFSKTASLSLRLFGNIFAGEVLITSIMSLGAFTGFFVPLPFMFLEILVGFIQALVFSVLVLVFMSMATTHQEH